MLKFFTVALTLCILLLKVLRCLDEESDIDLLRKILGKDFSRFISAISFFLQNRKLFGSTLDKLNNKRRKEIQEKELKISKPSFVDFFAGAGGLSCGFTQAGFRVIFSPLALAKTAAFGSML